MLKIEAVNSFHTGLMKMGLKSKLLKSDTKLKVLSIACGYTAQIETALSTK